MKLQQLHNKRESGVIVIITLLLVTILSSIVIALAAIIIPRIRVSSEIKRSIGALYAADSAIEWCLYKPKNPGVTLANPLSDGATWTLTQQPPSKPNCSESGAGPVKAIGTYQGVTRSLEISGF